MCPFQGSAVCSKHASSFTDFNLWDRALTMEEMVSWTGCHNMASHGNVIDWRTAQWQQINSSREDNVPYEDVCRSNRKPGLTFVPTR